MRTSESKSTIQETQLARWNNKKSSRSKTETTYYMRAESLTRKKLIGSTLSTMRSWAKRREVERQEQPQQMRAILNLCRTMRVAMLRTRVVTRSQQVSQPNWLNPQPSGRKMRPCSCSISSSMLQTRETPWLRTSPTQTGKPLPIWSLVALPFSARSDGSSSRTSKARNRLGRHARPRF